MDIEVIVARMKESELKNCLKEISEYSCFVDVQPAREKEVLQNAMRRLQVKFVNSYISMICTFNGGMLFSTKVYGAETEDTSFDLVSQNSYLHDEGALPKEVFAIAEEDYGDFICMRADGKSAEVFIYGIPEDADMAISERVCIGKWDSLYDWLMDELVAGEELIANDEIEPYL